MQKWLFPSGAPAGVLAPHLRDVWVPVTEYCGSVHKGRKNFLLLMHAGALSTTVSLGSRIPRDRVVSIAHLLLMGTVEKRGLLPRAESCLCWLSSVSNHMLMLHKQTAVLFGLSSS